MKILLTVHQFFPEHFSGTEVLTFSVAKELARRGHEVAVLTGFPAKTHLPDDDRFDEYEIAGLRVFRFHHAYVRMGGQSAVTEIEYDNHLVARYFARVVQTVQPDLIHFFHLSRLGAGLIDVAVKAGIPAYSTPTDFWSVCPTSQLLLRDGKVCAGPTAFGGNCVKHVAELTRGPMVQKVSRWVPAALVDAIAGATAKGLLPSYPMSGEVAAMARRRPFIVERLNWLHGIVSPTQLMTKVLTANGVDPGLILQSAYGIDIAAGEVPTVRYDGARKLTVGFIGTLAQHKGCHVLIEAFRALDPARAELKIYGNPSDFPAYFDLLKALAGDAPNIVFCGTFPNAEVANVLAGIDVLVVPSLWYENTPLVVYSALAAKRPLIVSEFSGLLEAVRHDWNGLTFPPGDVVRLNAALARLMNDAKLVEALSANCQRPKSSVEYVDELLALYARGGLRAQPASAEHARAFPPLADSRGGGFLAGWAVVRGQAPARLAVLKASVELAATTQFLPRPDVRDGLARGGLKLESALVGFTVRLPKAFQIADLTLRLASHGGEQVDVAMAHVNVGDSMESGLGTYVGLDSARQPDPASS